MRKGLKEDEKSERTIRSLLKLPENKRCINCNSLGPQYVCTTFLTFVCTKCSGVHREFTHRVKSVSMAKFNAEEVSALQAGGNERARQIYFKEWDPQYHSYPDAGNLHGLRSFIKHVYVDRKYTGERSVYTGERSIYTSERSGNKLPMLRLSTEESDENQKVGGHRSGSRSFHDDDRLERSYSNSPGGRSLRYYYDERRSPRYSPENSRSGGFIRAPLRFEIVDNRIRGGKRGSSSGESKVQSRIPDNKKTAEGSHSPVVAPVRDKLRENVPPPQVGESSTANQKDTDGSAHNQKTKSTGGHDGNATKQNMVSLIDFNTDSEPPHATESQLQQTPPPNEDNNWASFGSSTTEKAPQVPTAVPNADPLESLLFELSTPSSVPVSNASETPHNDGAPSTASINTMPAGGHSPADAGPVQDLAIFGGDTTVKGTDEKQLVLSTQQDQSSISFTADSGSTSHVNFAVGASNAELRNLSLAPSIQRSFSIPAEKSSQSILNPAEHTDSGSGAGYQVEMNTSVRMELPADLFTASYSSAPGQSSGWHIAPVQGMGYNMQYYPTATPAPVIPGPAKPKNPFDLNEEKSLVTSTHFPSMSSLQGALPNAPVPGLMHASSLPTMSQFESNESMTMPSHSPSFANAFSPRAYMGHQLPNNVQFLRPQGVGGFGRDEAAFGSLTTTQQSFQQPSVRYPAPSSSSSTLDTFSPMRGNPFG
ncbi:probable ADP-ribosylation factor GTPase-activating protein AGD14 isoform X2 [Pyrus x bretschneideri]|uniref:probable ADP-ribosylation factor GTPase-activating protein AGD14 isoform X2 n=1 Tax=Pyrus x bretschneideri TaxID=225117 RepID=UPI00202DB6C0|nr:probable ADP-ribosylation factor GTPase-activating protein AGD14 isoform X2 [Pyrus x bretschneideri]